MERKTRIVLMTLGGLLVASVATVGAVMAHGGAFNRAPAGFTVTDNAASGTHVTFTADAAAASVYDVDLKDANSTHPLLESVSFAPAEGATPTGAAGERGRGYVISDGAGTKLVVADMPRAAVLASTEAGTVVTYVFPEGAAITAHEAVADWSPAGASITYANGQRASLIASDGSTLAVDGLTVTVTLGEDGKVGFGVLPEDAKSALGPHGLPPKGPGPHGMRGPHGGHGMRGPPGGFGR